MNREIESREHVVGGAGDWWLVPPAEVAVGWTLAFLCLPEGLPVDEYLLVLLRASYLKSLSHRYDGRDAGGL